MQKTRTYNDPCGIARALDAIGERWAILIVRELLFGARRFTDLKLELGASPNVLSHRLIELEHKGIVARCDDGGSLYELTAWGRDLRPLLLQLGRWGARSPQRPKGELGIPALMVALESTFVPQAAVGLFASYELRLSGQTFRVDIDPDHIAIARGQAPRPDAIIETDGGSLRALVFGDRKLSETAVTIHGDARLGRKFFRLFARP